MVYMLQTLLISKGEKIVGDENLDPKISNFENFQTDHLN